MNTKTLKDLFLAELADIYDAEHRIIMALPKMAKAATCDKLRQALLFHLKQTEGHVAKLEQVFHAFKEPAKRITCEATVGLLGEGDEIIAEFTGSPALNAALISAAQKVEHHEIASYGCLHEWAGLLENNAAAGYLLEILKEEETANDSLTRLARAGNNEEALGKSSGNESKDKAGQGVIVTGDKHATALAV